MHYPTTQLRSIIDPLARTYARGMAEAVEAMIIHSCIHWGLMGALIARGVPPMQAEAMLRHENTRTWMPPEGPDV